MGQSILNWFGRVFAFIAALPLWVFLTACAGLILVVIFIVVLVKSTKRKKKKAPPSRGKLQRLQIGVIHQIGARDSQQDSFAVTDLQEGSTGKPGGFLALVADGIGGLPNGAQVSEIVANSFMDSFQQEQNAAPSDQMLMEYLSIANNEVNQYLKENKIKQAGTTLVAAIIDKNKLHFISVGDSRICLVRGGGLIQLNREHSYGAQLDKLAVQGSMEFGQARSDFQRGAITNFIGMGNIEQIDQPVRPIQLVRGDRVLIASDGIFNATTDQEIAEILQKNPPLDGAYRLEQLILAKQHPKQDNFTGVVIGYG